MRSHTAGRAAVAAGLVTAPTGVALLAAPHLAELAGLTPTDARLIGAVDLSLSIGLLAGRPRWPWAAARAAANVPTAAVLAWRGSPPGRAVAGLLVLLTGLDAACARSLRAAGR